MPMDLIDRLMVALELIPKGSIRGYMIGAPEKIQE